MSVAQALLSNSSNLREVELPVNTSGSINGDTRLTPDKAMPDDIGGLSGVI
jgi:hypothetical protein